MAKRVKNGDVISIPTSKGFGIAQITHKNEKYGHLIRVFTILSSEKDKFQPSIIHGALAFSTFFPVQACINEGLVSLVGNFMVDPKHEIFPIFQCPFPDLGIKTKNVSWLWDGQQSIKNDRPFTKSEEQYPKRSILTFLLLVERIETGFRDGAD